VILQLSNGGKAVDRVSGESADRLGDNQVDFPCQCIIDHGSEADSLFRSCSGDSFIGVDLDEFPIVSGLDVFGVVVDLSFVAGELLVVVR
jgi:hypothetical protein